MTDKKQSYKNWTPEEDKNLAEFLLKRVSEGATQLEAFEEYSKVSGRTAGSIGFRWNNKLRKEFKKLLQDAKSKNSNKKTKEKSSKTKEVENTPLESENFIQYKDIIHFLESQKDIADELERVNLEYKELAVKYDLLKEKFDHIVKVVQ